jgi:hypothetical protein
MASLRLFLLVIAILDLECQQADIVNVFINTIVGRVVIYIRQPIGYKNSIGRVYRLKKALYGLRTALLL